MGRPPTRPTRLRDGFYIEVRNKGAGSGMKIWSKDRPSMLEMAENYRKNKDVIILGEQRKDQWIKDGDDAGANTKSKSVKKFTSIVTTPLVNKAAPVKKEAAKEVVKKAEPAKKEDPRKSAKKPVKKPAVKDKAVKKK